MKRSRTLAVSVACLVNASIAFAADTTRSETAAPPGATDDSTFPQEVVVTAQKRSERLQDVPISMGVLNGEDLDRTSFESVTDALGFVPGVATSVANQGGGTQLTVRGVTGAGPLFAGASAVAYYVDSVPFGLVRSAIVPDASIYDLDRIEVLRGPQGTLYGASALNGVVRLLTRDPDLDRVDFKARAAVSGTQSGGTNYRGDMAVNVPIVAGKVAARLSASDEELSGWVDSPVKNDINDGTLRNVRLKIKAQATDALTIGFSAARSTADYGAPPQAGDNGRVLSLVDQPISTEYNTYGLKLDYELSRFTVSSASSYVKFENNGLYDTAPGVARPLLVTILPARVFAEEINLTSKLEGPWRWSAGLFYRDAKDTAFQTLGNLLPAPISFSDTSKSVAVFGDFGRRFADNRLEWSLGLRYFDDNVRTQQNYLYGQPAGTPLRDEEDTFNATTPRTVLSWYLDQDVTLYTSYSQGFRSGAPQNQLVGIVAPQFPALKPDKLTNYEVGAKGSVLDKRVAFDFALFYMDWQDIQQVLSVPIADGSPTSVSAPVNGSSASGAGVDLALSARVATGFDVGLSLGWNDLTEDEDVRSSGQILFAKGARIDYSPEFTGGVFARYGFPLGGSGLRGLIDASVRYTSEQTRTVGSATAPTRVFTSDTMTLGRFSFAVSSQAHWTTTLYADNVTDDRGALLRRSRTTDYDQRGRPRTIGLQVDYRFN